MIRCMVKSAYQFLDYFAHNFICENENLITMSTSQALAASGARFQANCVACHMFGREKVKQKMRTARDAAAEMATEAGAAARKKRRMAFTVNTKYLTEEEVKQKASKNGHDRCRHDRPSRAIAAECQGRPSSARISSTRWCEIPRGHNC